MILDIYKLPDTSSPTEQPNTMQNHIEDGTNNANELVTLIQESHNEFIETFSLQLDDDQTLFPLICSEANRLILSNEIQSSLTKYMTHMNRILGNKGDPDNFIDIEIAEFTCLYHVSSFFFNLSNEIKICFLINLTIILPYLNDIIIQGECQKIFINPDLFFSCEDSDYIDIVLDFASSLMISTENGCDYFFQFYIETFDDFLIKILNHSSTSHFLDFFKSFIIASDDSILEHVDFAILTNSSIFQSDDNLYLLLSTMNSILKQMQSKGTINTILSISISFLKGIKLSEVTFRIKEIYLQLLSSIMDFNILILPENGCPLIDILLQFFDQIEILGVTITLLLKIINNSQLTDLHKEIFAKQQEFIDQLDEMEDFEGPDGDRIRALSDFFKQLEEP